ncbi:MAG: tetratricopeptide (TPR) repeat protein [Myxococcota bacterium]|jgi:tetratricopeptide (TPR) repeat protein
MPLNEVAIGAGGVSPGDRIGAYEVLHRVARGGMASVIAVRDVRDGSTRAMKLLLPLDDAAEAQTRFRREFRALSRLSHPNILKVFEWGVHEHRPWFTMELLDGMVLKEATEIWRTESPRVRFEHANNMLIQVTRALAYAHDRGLVHRDVTPSNIMVDSEGNTKLMDFGVVKDLGADLTRHGEMIGTVAYISPEQIKGEAVDARADLYSLGAVLYLVLTGQRPFTARGLHGYLEKHLNEMPRPPREVEPLVPPHLDRICMRLLAKDPAARFASSAHLLHILGDTQTTNINEAWPPKTVGRTLQSARMRDSVDDLAQNGIGNALLLKGRTGMGKSRLLEQSVDYARRLGMVVARGRCRKQDRPFGAFIGVYRALIGDEPPAILEQVLGSVDDGVVRERYPVIRAFRDLVVSRAPVVIVLDDLENADPATAELLEYLIRNTLELQSEQVVFLLGQDTDSGSSERRLEDIDAVIPVDIGALGGSEVEELLLAMLPNDMRTRTLAERLHLESGGSPAFIADMMRGLVDEGVLVKEDGQWRITLDPTEITRSRLPIPTSLRDAIRERLRHLPAEAERVAQTLAISRRRLDVDALLGTLSVDEDTLLDAIDVLEEAGLVEERRDGDEESFELAQGRVRDVLLERMSPEKRQEQHQRLGEVLERQYRDQPAMIVEELAYQFEQAGLAPKAYAFLMQTARRHLRRSLHEEAMVFIDRALKLEPTARPLMLLDHADSTLSELHLARSLTRFHLGDWKGALESAERARALADVVPSSALQARVYAEYGNQLRNQGKNDEAEVALRRALSRADDAGDESLRPMPLYHLGALVWAKGNLVGAEQMWNDVVTSAQATGDDRALGFGYNGLGILAVCEGATAQARSHLEQSASLFGELGMLDALAIARVNLVELYLSSGILSKALGLSERTVAQAREVDHPHGIALGLVYRTNVLLELGRTREAEQNAAEALRLVRKLGQFEDEVTALALRARIALADGHPERALSILDRMWPMLEQHDSEGITPQAEAWRAHALALLGRTTEARALLNKEEDRVRQWPHLQVRTELARGQAYAALGDITCAHEGLSKALNIAQTHGYRFFQLCCHHELVRVCTDESERARHLRTGMSLARSIAGSLPLQEGRTFIRERWPNLAATAVRGIPPSG